MAAEGIDDLAAGDAAILDALYREDDARPAGGALDDAQRATFGEWQVVRGVVRHAREHGFDVEAPAAGTRGSLEMLMAAARAQAAPPTRGLWARLMSWMTPLIAHPAMAGAAALVVVGGAAGVLYLRGQHKVVRPPAQTQAADPTPAVSDPIRDGELSHVLGQRPPVDRPGPTARVDDGNDEGEERAGRDADGASPLTPIVTEGGRRPARGSGAPRGGDRREVKTLPKPPESPPLESAPAGGAGDIVRFGGGEEMLLEPTGNADRGEFNGVTATGRTSAAPTIGTVVATPPPASPMPAPASPPPPPPPVRAPTRSAQIATDDAPATAPSRRAQAEQLTAQARAAAKAGSCAKVAEQSRQVAALDPAYHRDVFVRDPDIARCR